MSTVPVFDYADFYAPGQHLTVQTDDGDDLTVVRVGDSRLLRHADGQTLRTSEEFRAAFPDGRLPDDSQPGWEWLNNAWFEPVTDDSVGFEGDVCHTLSEFGHATACTRCTAITTTLIPPDEPGPDGTDQSWCMDCVTDPENAFGQD